LHFLKKTATFAASKCKGYKPLTGRPNSRMSVQHSSSGATNVRRFAFRWILCVVPYVSAPFYNDVDGFPKFLYETAFFYLIRKQILHLALNMMLLTDEDCSSKQQE